MTHVTGNTKTNRSVSAMILGGTFAVLMTTTAAFATDEPGTPANTALADGVGLENTATVSGTYGPASTPVDNQAFEDVQVIPAAPAISLVKTIDPAVSTPTGPNGDYIEGDVIGYIFTVENTGQSYLYDVAITDPFGDGSGSLTAINIDLSSSTLTSAAPAGVSQDTDAVATDYDRLAPGDIVVFKSTYTVTAADMSAGSVDGNGDIDNSATAAGTYVSDPTDTSTDQTITSDPSVAAATLDIEPSLDVVKVSDATGPVVAGQTVTYTYTVENNGTVAINGVNLTDTHTSAAGPVVVSPTLTPASLIDNGTTGDSSDDAADDVYDTLAPGDIVEYTFEYVVTQDDIDQLQ